MSTMHWNRSVSQSIVPVHVRAVFETLSKGSRSCFWPILCLEAWGTEAKQPHMFQKRLVVRPCRPRRQCQNNNISLKMCGCSASVPEASNKPLGQQKHYGIPLTLAITTWAPNQFYDKTLWPKLRLQLWRWTLSVPYSLIRQSCCRAR